MAARIQQGMVAAKQQLDILVAEERGQDLALPLASAQQQALQQQQQQRLRVSVRWAHHPRLGRLSPETARDLLGQVLGWHQSWRETNVPTTRAFAASY